ncbi:hypothetical protein TGRD_077 [Candidatus Endomicrobiellum trichonymphae]|uniref:Uncharacterized protein n=1 Tax=Endomicrobium trichonymphae TaxID=1408204 RepID=B1GZ78_ENDTX|nr:hypothetical protein TGRD_077 [Candidatus Endomicrobium trichonymphae]
MSSYYLIYFYIFILFIMPNPIKYTIFLYLSHYNSYLVIFERISIHTLNYHRHKHMKHPKQSATLPQTFSAIIILASFLGHFQLSPATNLHLSATSTPSLPINKNQ